MSWTAVSTDYFSELAAVKIVGITIEFQRPCYSNPNLCTPVKDAESRTCSKSREFRPLLGQIGWSLASLGGCLASLGGQLAKLGGLHQDVSPNS
jgi:hypothetical protein